MSQVRSRCRDVGRDGMVRSRRGLGGLVAGCGVQCGKIWTRHDAGLQFAFGAEWSGAEQCNAIEV